MRALEKQYLHGARVILCLIFAERQKRGGLYMPELDNRSEYHWLTLLLPSLDLVVVPVAPAPQSWHTSIAHTSDRDPTTTTATPTSRRQQTAAAMRVLCMKLMSTEAAL